MIHKSVDIQQLNLIPSYQITFEINKKTNKNCDSGQKGGSVDMVRLAPLLKPAGMSNPDM